MTFVTAILIGSLVLLLQGPSLAQERTPLSVHEEVSGAPRTYTVDAKAGDAFVGTAMLKGTAGSWAAYMPTGRPVRTVSLANGEETAVGFIAPADGTFRIQIVGEGAGVASMTLRSRAAAERAREMSAVPSVRYVSRSIQQLATEVQSGDRSAVERFWTAAAAAKGPLVEPLAGDKEHVLVTFLWRETYETHNVYLRRPPYLETVPEYYLTRQPGTDVWYKTMKLHESSRFQYTFVPNHLPQEDSYLLSEVDPLNPRTFPENVARTDVYASSVLSLKAALDESWAITTPREPGVITDHIFNSSSLKSTLSVAVYTPPGYAAVRGPYPLVVLFDGPAYRRIAPNIVSNLIAGGRIRAPLVCLVSSVTAQLPDRAANLNTNPAFARAIATELVPWMRSSWAISEKPRDLVVGGSSAGANAALFIGLTHAAVFGNVLTMDAGAGLGRTLPGLFLSSSPVPIRIYMSQSVYVLRVQASLPPDEMAEALPVLATAPRLRDILVAKGYDVVSREVYGAHDALHFRAALADGLIALLPPRGVASR